MMMNGGIRMSQRKMMRRETFIAKVLVHRDGRPYLRDAKTGAVLRLSKIWKKGEKLKIVVTVKK